MRQPRIPIAWERAMDQPVQYFGSYVEAQRANKESLDINFCSRSVDIDRLWESSVLSSKFLSSYWSRIFRAPAGALEGDWRAVADSVRFIVAELLGNAVKFGCGRAFDIRASLDREAGELRFHVTNAVAPERLAEFQAFIRRLLSEDLETMYLAQMERSIAPDNPESGVGYLTILLDYQARLAWKFTRRGKLDLVTTFVALPVVRAFAKEGN